MRRPVVATAALRPTERPTAHRLAFGLLPLVLLALLLATLLAAPTASAQEVVQRGTWTAKGFDIDGGWSIVREGGKTVLVLDDGFATKSAPDLKIFLSPKPLAQLENRNATDGAVLVARLESNRGGQRYDLPGDLSAYRALIVHCEKYSKLWGGADLR